MAKRLKIIRNSKRTDCPRCRRPHEFLVRPTEGRLCDTPVAYPEDMAKQIANLQANGVDDVVDIPTGTDVVLDKSGRQLPVREQPGLAMYENKAQHA